MRLNKTSSTSIPRITVGILPLLIALFGCSSASLQQLSIYEASNPSSHAGWEAYFGNLHSHSGVSDGVETPPVAYAWARDKAKVNFLCLSEHNHINPDKPLEPVRDAALQATTPSFVGLWGQEYSTISGGNHVNVYNVVERVPPDMNNNYREFFTHWLPTVTANHSNEIVLCQFNHPADIERDYGIARIGGFPNWEGNWTQFVSEVDRWVRLIAIISGPADSNMSKSEVPPHEVHRAVESKMLRIWHQYLEKGFHISPVADQDNHRKSWGNRTAARTGVWLDGPLNRENLLKALNERRTFATTDKSLAVWFSVDQKPMGSRLPDPGAKDLAIEVKIEVSQDPGRTFSVELYRDVVGDGDLPMVIERKSAIQSGQVWSIAVEHHAGQHELYFAHVHQEAGDNDVWTGPIWLDPALAPEPPGHSTAPDVKPDTKYVGSKNSKVYHLPECRDVKKITAGNLVEYLEIPEGKQLHSGCPR